MFVEDAVLTTKSAVPSSSRMPPVVLFAPLSFREPLSEICAALDDHVLRAPLISTAKFAMFFSVTSRIVMSCVSDAQDAIVRIIVGERRS